MRNLLLVLGDQLDPYAPIFDNADSSQDAIWMAEVDGESTSGRAAAIRANGGRPPEA